jgi:thioredoxin
LTELTDENFEASTKSGKVVIDFYADWCGPCQMMKPTFEATSQEFAGKVNFLKLDTQAEGGLAMKFGVQGIPTFVMIHDGKEVARFVGYMGEDDFKSRINDVVTKL